MTTARQVSSPRLTEDEVQRGLAVVAKLEALQTEELAERGGVPLPDSVEIIHAMREERTGDLLSSAET
jgi:hypothetical protein